MKRIFSVLLTFIMLVSVFAICTFAASFKDITGYEYYAESATALVDMGILNGYEDGTFRADKPITRAEMATIVCRVLGQKSLAVSSTKFSDTTESHWASGYVNFAANNGIIGGDGNGNFRPQDNVKYEEAIKMTVCTIDFDRCLMTNTLDWSRPYIEIAKSNGITNGLLGTKGSFATRGDVAVMIYNAIKARDSRVLSVPAIIKDSKTIAPAEIKYFSGSLVSHGAVNNHTFIPEISGTYRLDLSNMHESAKVSLTVLNELGEKIWDGRGIRNGGATLERLEKGKTYTIQVGQYIDVCGYTLSVGCQKNAVDARSHNVIYDSINYTDQVNYYGFVPKTNGNYALTLEGIHADAKISVVVLNDLAEKIWESRGVQNSTVPLPGLKAGKTYTIQVRQYFGVCNYTLNINLYKTPFYIQDLVRVNDSIEYTHQTNTYGFVAQRDGSHTFALSGIHEGAKVEFVVYNSLGEMLKRGKGIGNAEISVDFNKGETYVVQVVQYYDLCNYSLTIN